VQPPARDPPAGETTPHARPQRAGSIRHSRGELGSPACLTASRAFTPNESRIVSNGLVTKSGVVGPGTDRTTVYRRGRKLVVSVDGQHTSDAALQAAQYLLVLLADIAGPVELVADLSSVTGITAEGQRHWQEAFERARHRIQLITVVQGTALARMAASAVGLYAGIKVRFVDTLEEALRETKVE
jgi:hypothetical protein